MDAAALRDVRPLANASLITRISTSDADGDLPSMIKASSRAARKARAAADRWRTGESAGGGEGLR